MSIILRVIGAVVLLTVAYEILWVDDTPPDDPPQRHQPVDQPPTPRPPPPQSYRPPYTRLLHQPEQYQPVDQSPPYSPAPSQGFRSSPYGPPESEDDEQPNECNLGLRARANTERDEMQRCFNESRLAYSRGNHSAAKDLSNRGTFHRQEMERLNKDASEWIFYENNRDCRPGEVDLHRLRVKEAIARTDAALEEAKLRGDSESRFIVGKGLHSEGGEAKVRPAIKALMRKYKLAAEFDPSNSGVLVVRLGGSPPIHRRSRRRRQRANNVEA